MIMTAMNLPSTDAFLRSPQLSALCLVPTNCLSDVFHPSFPLQLFKLVFDPFYEEQENVIQLLSIRSLLSPDCAPRRFPVCWTVEVQCSGFAKY